jgi:hypothetical protein
MLQLFAESVDRTERGREEIGRARCDEDPSWNGSKQETYMCCYVFLASKFVVWQVYYTTVSSLTITVKCCKILRASTKTVLHLM